MPILQPIIDIAELCHQHGIKHVVVSPGSRSAALTLAFARSTHFEMHVVMDERAAGFIALGMAQQLNKSVVLICTSGSAAYNYAPAVAEAFFQQIPLLILTADRPQEWIHQLDGQTIFQAGIYGKHVKADYNLPADYTHSDSVWMINRTCNEAILVAESIPPGPVHMNVPIREPFYPSILDEFKPTTNLRKVTWDRSEKILSQAVWHELVDEWNDSPRVLIVSGQHQPSNRINDALKKITEELHVPIIADSIGNLQGSALFIKNHDLFVPVLEEQDLRPNLLITYGLSVISKSLKQFLRQYPSTIHWHIADDTHIADPFQSITRIISATPEYFFAKLLEEVDFELYTSSSEVENDINYFIDLQKYNLQSETILNEYIDTIYNVENITNVNDMLLVSMLCDFIDNKSTLCISNSMSIRYVNTIANCKLRTNVYCNRGTSGIDGCVSTAIGAAMMNNVPTYLLTGDVAFLYDRNGLLLNPLPKNLKIIILNNAGGNIFRMIEGPSELPERDQYFETRHTLSAKHTAAEASIEYMALHEKSSLEESLSQFIHFDGPCILEVFTDPEQNTKVWKGLKSYIKKVWK